MLTSLMVLALGLVLGVVGTAVVLKARIMQDVSVSDSPHGG